MEKWLLDGKRLYFVIFYINVFLLAQKCKINFRCSHLGNEYITTRGGHPQSSNYSILSLRPINCPKTPKNLFLVILNLNGPRVTLSSNRWRVVQGRVHEPPPILKTTGPIIKKKSQPVRGRYFVDKNAISCYSDHFMRYFGRWGVTTSGEEGHVLSLCSPR